MAFKSETPMPRESKCCRSVGSVEAGPGSMIARCPSDSSNAAAIDRARPIQFVSSRVVVSIEAVVYRESQLQFTFCRSLS